MRAAMPQDIQGVAVFFGENLERDDLGAVQAFHGGKLTVEIDYLAVHFGGDGGLGQAPADALGHLARPTISGNFLGCPIRQSQGEHLGHGISKSENRNSKSETNPKFEVKKGKGGLANYQLKNVQDFFRFGLLDFEFVSDFRLRISDLLSDVGHQSHEAGSLDGVFDRALESRAGAAPFLAVQLALAGAELFETLHVLVIDIGRPRAAFFGAEPAAVFPSAP
jgi:hypothetical protein